MFLLKSGFSNHHLLQETYILNFFDWFWILQEILNQWIFHRAHVPFIILLMYILVQKFICYYLPISNNWRTKSVSWLLSLLIHLVCGSTHWVCFKLINKVSSIENHGANNFFFSHILEDLLEDHFPLYRSSL